MIRQINPTLRYICFIAFVKAYTNVLTQPANLRLGLSVYIFVCFTQFTLLVYKSLIMVVENFQKYHWIQHTNTQPVVITRKRNKLL